MTNLILQFVCAALLAIGLFFIGVELRVRHDRSHLYFGGSLLLLCAIASLDVWVLPAASQPWVLEWVRLKHILAIAFVVLLNLYLMRLAGGEHPRYLRGLFGYSLALIGLFCTPLLLTLRNQAVATNWIYPVVVGPYAAYAFGGVITWLIPKARFAPPEEKKVLRLHLLGLSILFAGIVVDLLGEKIVTWALLKDLPHFSTLGVLGFGICASGVFAERFFFLVTEKEGIFSKLEAAYTDMEKASQLRQLGESTAMINHEIKNYMFMISGNAQLLQEFETLSPKGQAIVNNIISAVDRLTRFSRDILELSRNHLLRDAQTLGFTDLIRRTCQIHFAGRKEFLMLRLQNDVCIQGDPDKLEQMLVNLIQNAFEATKPGEMPDIRLTLRQAHHVVLLSIEDHGCGCNEENLVKLFKAFHTTKRGKGGNGLGMSLAKTIVESHGGKINGYSKNFSSEGEHGLILNLSFPPALSPKEDTEEKAPFILVPEGMEDLEGMLRIFGNVFMAPHIVSGLEELYAGKIPLSGKILMLSSRSKEIAHIKPPLWRQTALITCHHRQLYLTGEAVEGRTELFTEDVLLRLTKDDKALEKPKPVPQRAVALES